jgi:hypothetical protein
VDEAAREIGTVQPDTRGPQDGQRDGKPVGLENLSRCWHLRADNQAARRYSWIRQAERWSGLGATRGQRWYTGTVSRILKWAPAA